MIKTTYKWFEEHKQEVFESTVPSAYCVISKGLEVHTGSADDCNYEYCQEHNIPVYDLGRTGGTIVCCSGTIGVALITDVKHGWRNDQFINDFVDYLYRKGLKPEVKQNDILIDDYKVASAAEWRVGNNLSKVYGVYLISWNVDLEAIQNICKKEMKKIPKGLKEFGLTKKELVAWVENYFNNISINL